MTNDSITDDAVRAVQWLCSLGQDARVFSVNDFHKGVLRGGTRDEVNTLLGILESIGVVGAAYQTDLSNSGRSKEVRNISDAPTMPEGELRQRLADALETAKAADGQRSAQAELEVLQQARTTAIAIYDWASSDYENIEIDSRNRPVISLGRLAKHVTDPEPGLALLRQYGVIGDRYVQQDFRQRVLIPLVPQMFGPGLREKVADLIMPPPPKPYKAYGPLRVLNPVSVPVNGLFMRFVAGQVVTDESTCCVLVKANAPVARVDDDSACYCPKCRLRFQASEQGPLETPPLIVMQYFLQVRNGCWTRRWEGDFITDPGSVQHALKNFSNLVSVADRWRYQVCPACGTVSLRAQLQAVVA